MFALGKTLQPSPMFESKVWAYPRLEILKGKLPTLDDAVKADFTGTNIVT
jgi:hypothetical protein